MNMITVTAMKNMKYKKGRNLLIGIAIVLTAILLFLIPSIGYNAIKLQNAMTKELYPNWHAVFGWVDEKTVQELQACSGIEKMGARYDAAQVVSGQYDIGLYYFDENCLSMNLQKLEEGRLPEEENEMAVSREMLKALGIDGELGDTIEIPYQLRLPDGLDYQKNGRFILCGFLPDNEESRESGQYLGIVSQEFIRKNFDKEQPYYYVYLQVAGIGQAADVLTVENAIYKIAEEFGIDKQQVQINEESLSANYVDPTVLPMIITIMAVIITVGMITIYSIYYISMTQNIREFGKLKAIGATGRQLRQIVLQEGMAIAVLAVPAGLLCGSFLLKKILFQILDSTMDFSKASSILRTFLDTGKVGIYHVWIYATAAAVSFLTVYLSLLKPAGIAARISSIEAIRFHGGAKKKDMILKGYDSLSIGKLAKRNLGSNKKRTAMTILSMSATGILYIIAATVLSCANPEDSADNRMPGEYEIKIDSEEGNREHPEYAWKEIQKKNPLSDSLKETIGGMQGVESVDVFSTPEFSCDELENERHYLLGIPENYWKEIKKAIIEGSATYNDLKTGDKVILSKAFLYWFPQFHVGQQLDLRITDGDQTVEKTVEIIAIANVPNAISQFEYFIMADEGIKQICRQNQNFYFHVQAESRYEESLYQQLKALVEQNGGLTLSTWQSEYEMWVSTLSLMRYLCYGFLLVLGAVGIMNLINTIINSIQSRKKELGILQAIGLSGKQLSGMLQIESLFYTAGALLLSLGIGMTGGYWVYLYMKANQMLNIRRYHIPYIPVAVLFVLVLLVQLLITYVTAVWMQKESLIERIRLHE